MVMKEKRSNVVTIAPSCEIRIHWKGFTLVELLVVIAIIALLMAVLMPALNRVKKQARTVSCQAQLKQWGIFFKIYCDDNDNKFMTDKGNNGGWRFAIQTFEDRKVSTTCPEASNPDKPPGTFGTWGGCPEHLDGGSYDGGPQDCGSYGINRWVYNIENDQGAVGYYWQRCEVTGSSKIPLFLDCNWYGGSPRHTDAPPSYDGDKGGNGLFPSWSDQIKRFALNRHNGAINGLFMDFTVRKIGLKQLWKFQWHQKFDTTHISGPWPMWMKNFKEY